MVKRKKRSWMGNTGAAILSLGTLFASLSKIFPVEKHRGWFDFFGMAFMGLGSILMGKGIHRRLPKRE